MSLGGYIAQARLAQNAADVVFLARHPIADRFLHVDFEQKMHAAGQVETIGHRFATERLQPLRRSGREVQRDDELRRGVGIALQRG